MEKNVVGIYGTSFEAMKAIDTLRHDGIDNEHIYVVANDELRSHTIEEKTGVVVKDGQENEVEHHNFREELKSFFTDHDAASRYSDNLLDIGMTEADVERYANKVENGHILVLVDSDVDQGRSRLLSTENIPVNETINVKVHGEEVDNNTTGDHFDQEEHTPQAGRSEIAFSAANSEHDPLQQAGRPKEREKRTDSLQGRQKEYEEEVNPFENRYSSGSNGSNDQPDYGNSPT